MRTGLRPPKPTIEDESVALDGIRVRIIKRPHKVKERGKTYEYTKFVLKFPRAWGVNGQKSSSSLKAAQEKAVQMLTDRWTGGDTEERLSPADVRETIRAKKELPERHSLFDCVELAAWIFRRIPSAVTVKRAIDHWLLTRRVEQKLTVSEARQKWLEFQGRRLCDEMTLKNRIGALRGATRAFEHNHDLIDEVEPHIFQNWILSGASDGTKKNRQWAVGSLLRYSRDVLHALPEHAPTAVEMMPKIRVDRNPEIEAYSPIEAFKVIFRAPWPMREILLWAFATGMRFSEIFECPRSALDMSKAVISLSGKITKTKRGRQIDVWPWFIAWIEKHHRNEGTVGDYFDSVLLMRSAIQRYLFRELGEDFVANGPRHTVATYLLRLTDNVEYTERQLGTSQEMLDQNYVNRLVSRRDAVRYVRCMFPRGYEPTRACYAALLNLKQSPIGGMAFYFYPFSKTFAEVDAEFNFTAALEEASTSLQDELNIPVLEEIKEAA